MLRITFHGLLIASGVLLSSCAAERIGNAPPDVVEDCRSEIAILRGRDITSITNDSLRDTTTGPDRNTIEEARIAREESKKTGVASWPDEPLMYRCLASRGIPLTEDQAETLAEWKTKLNSAPTHK